MAKPYRRKDSRFYWIAPMIGGVQRPRSSETTDYAEACAALKVLEGRIASGEPVTARIGRSLFSELLDDMITKYRVDRRITDPKDPILKRDLLAKLTHIRPAFGHLRTAQITKSVINKFVEDRQGSGAANSTINQELSAIKRAFRLAYPDKVLVIPKITMLKENNDRDGYYEPEQFQQLAMRCDELTAAVLTVAYITGWRIQSIVTLQWRNVDLKTGFVRLNANETKNRLAVRWPLVCGLREIFERRLGITEEVQRRRGMVIAAVFHRNGKPAKTIRGGFQKARREAQLQGYRVHDFRGTATVNLLESGADLSKVMGMVGFKTVQMVQRYAKKRGLREKSLAEAGELLEKRMGTTLVTTFRAKADKK